ncbi:MAG: acetylglutamate kinase [Catonella sp.]|jgi:acetylglutamate kinase|nr:acetylglutamate kinase [Catonella sp.]MDY6357829.1 acetylglutamate kinase [Catonella sp.]
MENLDEIKKKAEVLIEALPYIQKFSGKTVVVKYGGSAMTEPKLKRDVIKDVSLLKLVGFRPIIVHGGGKAISTWIKKTGGEPKFVNGLRVTDEETMEIAEMVLNRVNKGLVALIESVGVRAVGISGKDAGLLKVKKKKMRNADLGYVGEITDVDPSILTNLMDDDIVPVVCPIGYDENYDTYNINADDAACAIAKAVGAEKLVFLTDIDGVYKDINDKSTFISRLTCDEADKLIDEGVIGGGMLPKIAGCVDAARNGVNRVHILDGRVPHVLLLEFFTDHGIGTMFMKEKEKK